jgi:hypothetical protein
VKNDQGSILILTPVTLGLEFLECQDRERRSLISLISTDKLSGGAIYNFSGNGQHNI